MYTSQELSTIRSVIAGKISLTAAQLEKTRQAYIDGKIPPYLRSLFPIYETDPGLFSKLLKDQKAKQFSHFGFFPATYSLVYESGKAANIAVGSGTSRGLVVLIGDCEGVNVVIKPLQSLNEHSIAKTAGMLSIGPRQLETIEGYISEEFISADVITKLPAGELAGETLHAIGMRLGEIFTKLHASGIYYNDTIISDDFGRSHLFVPEPSKALLFDYGVAISLEKYPEFTVQEVYNYFKTVPGVNMQVELAIRSGEDENRLAEGMAKELGPELRSTKKIDILNRDLQFIQEGAWLASGRLGVSMAPLVEGFEQSYVQPGN